MSNQDILDQAEDFAWFVNYTRSHPNPSVRARYEEVMNQVRFVVASMLERWGDKS